ncbi:hypothetical protein Sjap_016162 [Stephania japonica]|uniref:Apyrase 7 n=1 Tax=Stephania japonica TaxID=461633 RepID=A0AAP0IL22_9MAGN
MPFTYGMESRIPTINSRLSFMYSQFSRCYLKVAIIIIFSVLVLASIFLEYQSGIFYSGSRFTYFTVVLDCGSTGTRVNVYEWSINSPTSQDLPRLMRTYPDDSKKNPGRNGSCQYHCMQTEPGLHSFVFDSSGLFKALEPLLQWAERLVPSERHGDTPVFLLATAGLRKLPSENVNWILRNAEDLIKRHRFVYEKSSIRVLSGQEEAYYGWVALNYKMERLGRSFKVPTLGVLDLGGSSLQFVMETDGSRDNTHSIKSQIGLFEYQILAQSLPAFGLNEAFERTIALLANAQVLSGISSSGFQLKHPCLSTGFSMNYSCYDCLRPNLTVKGSLSGELRSNLSTLIYLVGDLDWEQCQQISRFAAINSSFVEFVTGTKLNLTSLPVARFHALSGFFAVYSVTNLTNSANLTSLVDAGRQLCSRSWLELKKLYGNQKYVERLCFQVTYITSLLDEALHMGSVEIIFGPGDVSWTLGAVLDEGKNMLKNPKALASCFIFKNMGVFLSSPTLLFTLTVWFFIVIIWARFRCTMASVEGVPGKKGIAVEASIPTFMHSTRQSKNFLFASEQNR